MRCQARLTRPELAAEAGANRCGPCRRITCGKRGIGRVVHRIVTSPPGPLEYVSEPPARAGTICFVAESPEREASAETHQRSARPRAWASQAFENEGATTNANQKSRHRDGVGASV